ncbi:conserved protein of unknown function [Pseudomonas mediterranea]
MFAIVAEAGAGMQLVLVGILSVGLGDSVGARLARDADDSVGCQSRVMLSRASLAPTGQPCWGSVK